MLGSSFTNVIAVEEGEDRISIFHHLDVTNEICGAAIGRPNSDLVAHEVGGLGDERIEAVLAATGVDDRGRIDRGQPLTQGHPSLDDREASRTDDDDVHSSSGGLST